MNTEDKMCCRCGGAGHLAHACKLPLLTPDEEIDNERFRRAAYFEHDEEADQAAQHWR